MESEIDARVLGTNLWAPSYYGNLNYFNDITQEMSGFFSSGPGVFDDGRTLVYDEDGWPVLAEGQWARSLILSAEAPSDGEDPHRPGDYTLTWEGEADFAVEVVWRVDGSEEYFSARFAFDDAAGQIAENRGTVTLPADIREIELQLVITEMGDIPLSDIALYLPGTDETSGRFDQTFLEIVEPFSTLRLMDWAVANWAYTGRWEERAALDWATWGTSDDTTAGNFRFAQGIPYEVMVELANLTQKDIWISIPHAVDDDYVRNLAQLLEDTLDPRLTINLEYSNEAWNGIFPVAEYLDDRAAAVREAEGLEDFFRAEAYARRSVEIFEIFETVFDDDARVVNTLSGQAGWAAPLGAALAEVARMGRSDLVEELAVAPYFPNFEEGEVLGIGTEMIADGTVTDAEWRAFFDALIADVEGQFDGTTEVGVELALQRDMADALGVDLVTYEAGQHVVADFFGTGLPAEFGAFMAEFQNRPEMAELWEIYLDGWEAFGGGEMILFTLAGLWGPQEAFGLLEYGIQDPASSVKYSAVLDWLGAAPAEPAPAPVTVLTDGPDVFVGGDAGAEIRALRGGDVVVTGAGEDSVDAGPGGDIVKTGAGDDRVRLGDGADILLAGAGADSVNAGDGGDVVKGGAGDDWLHLGLGDDTGLGGDGDDILRGVAGDDVIKTGRGADLAFGGAGHDILLGFRGEEGLDGGLGNDTLYGGLDDDRLIGGRGNDRLIAGPGRDVLVFAEADFGEDRAIGFRVGSDSLDFRGSGITGLQDLAIAEIGGHTVAETAAGGRLVLAGVDDLIGREDAVFVFDTV